ncbi:MAG TPA: hypothetical protein VIE63_07775 [Ramlibacter sp.]|jgi:enamine deaminase RidA (YjgF/YER057c/UK114 family)
MTKEAVVSEARTTIGVAALPLGALVEIDLVVQDTPTKKIGEAE